jgi:hypothetical protein
MGIFWEKMLLMEIPLNFYGKDFHSSFYLDNFWLKRLGFVLGCPSMVERLIDFIFLIMEVLFFCYIVVMLGLVLIRLNEICR